MDEYIDDQGTLIMKWDEIIRAISCVLQTNAANDSQLRFNSFVLASDLYYRENFHSDILREILDPKSSHGEGNVFLQEFLKYLEEVCEGGDRQSQAELLRQARNEINEDVRVIREEGRIDILIEGVFKSGEKWRIIVENKINGAVDMPRQLPRYLDYYWQDGCRDRTVIAIVYLKASSDSVEPSHNNWDDVKYGWKAERGSDVVRVSSKLIKIAGYRNKQRCLAQNWLWDKCLPRASKDNVRAVLFQYVDLLKIQSEESMNSESYKSLFNAMGDMTIADLSSVVNDMPSALAQCLRSERFEVSFKNVGLAYSAICYFDLNDIVLDSSGKKVWLAIDVDFRQITAASSVDLSVFVRNDRAGYCKINNLLGLDRLNCLSGFELKEDNRFRLKWDGVLPKGREELKKKVEQLAIGLYEEAPRVIGKMLANDDSIVVENR